MKSPPKMPQMAMVRIWVASLHQKSFSVTTTLELFVLYVRETHECGWIRTASARRTVRRAKKPLCNSDDRCQRQKQGGAVGAAASRMRVPPKARCSRWEPRPGLLILRGSRNPPAPTRLTAPVCKHTGAVLFLSAQGCSSIRHVLEVEKNGAFVTNLSQKGYKPTFSTQKDCETIVYLVSYRGGWPIVPVCEKK